MDIVHGFSGHCPWTEWTLSMDWMDNVHGMRGHCPWARWTLSMDPRSNTPAEQCPLRPWTLYRLFEYRIKLDVVIRCGFRNRILIAISTYNPNCSWGTYLGTYEWIIHFRAIQAVLAEYLEHIVLYNFNRFFFSFVEVALDYYKFILDEEDIEAVTNPLIREGKENENDHATKLIMTLREIFWNFSDSSFFFGEKLSETGEKLSLNFIESVGWSVNSKAKYF